MMGKSSFFISSEALEVAKQKKMELHEDFDGTSKEKLFPRNRKSGKEQEKLLSKEEKEMLIIDMIEITKEVEEPLCNSSLSPDVVEQEKEKVCDYQNYVSEKELSLNNKKSVEEENMLSEEEMEVIILDMIEIEKEIEEPVEEFLESIAPKMNIDATIKVENQVDRTKEASKALLELASSFPVFDRPNLVEPIAEEKHEIAFEKVSNFKESMDGESKTDSLICEEYDSEATLSASEGQELCNDEELINPYHGDNVDHISNDHNYCLPYSARIEVSSSVPHLQLNCDNLKNVKGSVRRPNQIIPDHEYTKKRYTGPAFLEPSPLTKGMPRQKAKRRHFQKYCLMVPQEEDFHSACVNCMQWIDHPPNVLASPKKIKRDRNNRVYLFGYSETGGYPKLDVKKKAVSSHCATSSLDNVCKLPKRKEAAAAIKKKYKGNVARYKASGGGKSKEPRKNKGRKSTPVICYKQKFKSKKYVSSSSDSSDEEDKPLMKLKSKGFTSNGKQWKEAAAAVKKKYEEKIARYKSTGRGKSKEAWKKTLMKDKGKKSAAVLCHRQKLKSKKYITSSSESSSDSTSESSSDSTSDSSSDSSDEEDKPLTKLKSKGFSSNGKDNGKENTLCHNRNNFPSGKSNSLLCSKSSSLYNCLSKKKNSKKKCINPSSNSTNHEIPLKNLVVVLEDCMKLNNMTQLSHTKQPVCNRDKSNYLPNSSPSKLPSRVCNSLSKRRNSTKNKCTNSSNSRNEVHLKKLVVVLEDCMKLNYMTQLLPTKHLVCDQISSNLESNSVSKQHGHLTSLNNIENNNIADVCSNSKSKSYSNSETSISDCCVEDNSEISRTKSLNPCSEFSNDPNSLKVTEYTSIPPNTKETTNQTHSNENESQQADDQILPQLIDDIKIEPLSTDEYEYSDSDVELLCVKEPTAELITLEDDVNEAVESAAISEIEKS